MNEHLKSLLSTVLGMALGGAINANTTPLQNPNALAPHRPTVAERFVKVIERNPYLVINPLLNGSTRLCQRIFHSQTDLESHPIPVDSEGQDLVGQRNPRRRETIFNVLSYSILVVACITTIRLTFLNKAIPINMVTENSGITTINNPPIQTEILTDTQIIEKAGILITKQIMLYIPFIAFGLTITIAGYIAYERYSKIQIKKEELILRQLQRINTKLNLLPETKES